MYINILLFIVLGLTSLAALALLIYIIKVACFEKTYDSLPHYIQQTQLLLSGDSSQPNYFTTEPPTNISDAQQGDTGKPVFSPSEADYQLASQNASGINAQGIITLDPNVFSPHTIIDNSIPIQNPNPDITVAPVLIPAPITLPAESTLCGEPIPLQSSSSNIIVPVARRPSTLPQTTSFEPSVTHSTLPLSADNSFQPITSSFIPENPTPPPASGWINVYPTGTRFKGDPMPIERQTNSTLPHPTTPPTSLEATSHPTSPPHSPPEKNGTSPSASPIPTTPTSSTPQRVPRATTPPSGVLDVTPRLTTPPPTSPNSYISAAVDSPTLPSPNVEQSTPSLTNTPTNPRSSSPVNYIDVRSTMQRFPSYTSVLPKVPDPAPSPVPIASLQGEAALCKRKACNKELMQSQTRGLCESCDHDRTTTTSVLGTLLRSDEISDASSDTSESSAFGSTMPVSEIASQAFRPNADEESGQAPIRYDAVAGPSSAGPSSSSVTSSSSAHSSNFAVHVAKASHAIKPTEKWKSFDCNQLCGKNPKNMVANCGHCMCRQCMMEKQECGFCKQPITRGQTIQM